MNQMGIKTAIDVASDYFGLDITEEWFVEHLDEISSYFPAADDPGYLEDFPGEEVWWTFEAECETGGIWDTAPRETYGNALAMILTGDGWPLYIDGPTVAEQFKVALANACEKESGISYQ